MFVLHFVDITLSFKHLSLFYHFITSHICLVPLWHDKRSQLLANLIGYLPKYFISYSFHIKQQLNSIYSVQFISFYQKRKWYNFTKVLSPYKRIFQESISPSISPTQHSLCSPSLRVKFGP